MPHLSKDEQPRANSLHGSPLDETTMLKMSATTRGRGKCDKIEGLVFDTAQPMFEPQNWKYPITKNIVSIDLELCVEGFNGIDNVESHLVHVHRHANRDVSKILSTCETIANNYSAVRSSGWGGVGSMFSAGYNVGYKGCISSVALSPKMKKMPKQAIDAINNDLFTMGSKFFHEFHGINVGYDEMLQEQKNLWPKNRFCPEGPACWIVSKDLGNPQHVDADHSRSYARWFTKKDIQNQSAWFLFPKWGIAIELSNDTWISWDGAQCAHCSSIPHLSNDNHIYSLFTAITKKVFYTAERVNKCEAILSNGTIEFTSLKVNDKVTLRWVPPPHGDQLLANKRALRKYGNKHRRWLHCIVMEVDSDAGTVELREYNKNKRVLPKLSKSEMKNRVIPGWI